MSSFNPDQFLDGSTTEASVRRPPLKPGTELMGIITELKAGEWKGKKDPSQSGYKFELKIECDTAHLVGEGQPEKVTFNDSIMLQTTDGGAIDYGPGKNARLRQYREATNLNVAGQPFSPRMMEGRQIRVRTKVETYEGELYDRVDQVARV